MVKNNLWITALLFISCDKQQLSPGEFLHWVDQKDNGLIKSETMGEVKYTVAYRPPMYSKAKALATHNDTTLLQGNAHMFVIKMEPVDGRTPVLTIGAIEKEEPYLRIGYYLSEAPKYIKLVTGGDTLSAASYLYERYYNISPAQSLVIGFVTPAGHTATEDMTLVVEDKMQHTGAMYFNYSAGTLKNIPGLIMK